MDRTEADIKRAIELYLKSQGYLVIPFRTTGIRTKHGWIPARRKGIADLIGVTSKGRFWALEIKTEKGKTTPEQEQFLQDVCKHKGIAGVARCIADVDRIFNREKGFDRPHDIEL